MLVAVDAKAANVETHRMPVKGHLCLAAGDDSRAERDVGRTRRGVRAIYVQWCPSDARHITSWLLRKGKRLL
jgi:hypothetical protein